MLDVEHMRIALVTHKFPPASIGGTEVYVQNLARGLSQRHEVSVFYRDDGDGQTFREEWRERENFHAWRVGRAFDTKQAKPVALFWDTFYNRDVEASFDRFLNEVQPQIVHFHHLMLLSYRLIAQAKRRGLPCLLTLHDYWFICANSQLVWPDAQVCQGKAGGLNCAQCATARIGRRWTKFARLGIAAIFRLRDSLVRRAALKADLLIAPSQFLTDQYIAAGFPVERFRRLENGVDVERIQAFARQPSTDGRLRVTYLGSLAWQKGVHILIQAVSPLPPDRIHLRVFGRPGVFPDYAASLQRAANPANTTFEGALPHHLVGRALAESDVLVVPSLWYENSPVVVQEAFAAGVPVVVSRLGALEEKVWHEASGLSFAAGNVEALRAALEQLISRAGLVEHLRQGIPPAMSVQQHMQEIEGTYRWALERHTGNARHAQKRS
jgi:glycosyltransferase involved in cell wall biosynthesis